MDEPRLDALEHRLRALDARLRAVEVRLSSTPVNPGAEPPSGGAEGTGDVERESLRERLQNLGERVYSLEAHAPAKMAETLLRVEARLGELERSRAEPPAPPPAEVRRRGRGLRLLQP